MEEKSTKGGLLFIMLLFIMALFIMVLEKSTKGRLAFHHGAAGGNLIHCTTGHAMETDILEVGKRTELLHAHFLSTIFLFFCKW